MTAAPAALVEAGLRELASDDPARRILGTRLVREAHDPTGAALGALTRAVQVETDTDVLVWVIKAFGFVRSDLVTELLLALVAHPDDQIRYDVATALANCDVLSEASLDALTRLAVDPDPEVRFSAVFELGACLQTDSDPQISQIPRIRAVVGRAVHDPEPMVARAAVSALAEAPGEG